MLKKIMIGGREKGKRRYYPSEQTSPTMMQPANLSKTNSQGKNATRRVTVLNKLFMKNVTDLMATGEMSTEILGRGLEISRVRVTTDFQGLLVYWLAKGSDDDIVLDQILKKAAGPLRHELSQLRLMGEVPKITFVRDIHYAMAIEVDNLLKKSVHELEETEDSSPVSLEDDEFPSMRHDMYSLDRESIFQKIKKSVDKSKEAWTRYGTGKSDFVVSTEDILRSAKDQENFKSLDEELVNFMERNRQKKKRLREDRELELVNVYSQELKYEEVEDFLDEEDNEVK